MFVAGNFMSALAQVLDMALTVYMWIVIVRALISWVNPDPYNPIVRFLVAATEPVLRPIRRLVPTYRIGIDLSPLIVILAIYFLNFFLVRTLIDLSYRIR
ncbi:MAG: YggT family protein [Nitrospirae bacterium]|nr:YggT family protein [Nitrospirota bacterium]MBI3392750.1 YggT family protein [Nitrospirota bacterium]